MLAFLVIALLAAGDAGSQGSRTADEGERASDAPEKVICKRFTETGSLVRAQRVCKTKRDWDRERAVIRSAPTMDSCSVRGEAGNC